MCPAKQKIIQKRVQRKERFARMARMRYRKQTNVIAKSEILADIEKATDNHTLVHQYSPGIFFGERDGGIDCETSMLNKNYLSNCITVAKEDDVNFVKLKLCKNASKAGTPSLEELENWKKKGHSHWSEWAERFKNFSQVYNNFLQKHKDYFKTGKLDEEYARRYKKYQEIRKALKRNKLVIEVRTRFDLEEDYVSEISYNETCVEKLGYDMEEFVEKVLREGIPRIKCTESDNGFMMKNMMDNFEAVFENTKEFRVKKELRLLTKGQQLKNGDVSLFITGYFYKKKAEISYLIVCNGMESFSYDDTLLQSYHIPIAKDEALEKLERKNFIEKYYRPPPPASWLFCQIKEVDVLSCSGDEVSTKMESEETKVKEETWSRSYVGYIGKDQPFNEDYNNINHNISSANNALMYPVNGNEGHSGSFRPLDNAYNSLLNSYMFLFQNNLFDSNEY